MKKKLIINPQATIPLERILTFFVRQGEKEDDGLLYHDVGLVDFIANGSTKTKVAYELQRDGSWKQIAVGHGIPEIRGFDMVVNPANADIVYVPEAVSCVAKTTNGGVSWDVIGTAYAKELTSDFQAHSAEEAKKLDANYE